MIPFLINIFAALHLLNSMVRSTLEQGTRMQSSTCAEIAGQQCLMLHDSIAGTPFPSLSYCHWFDLHRGPDRPRRMYTLRTTGPELTNVHSAAPHQDPMVWSSLAGYVDAYRSIHQPALLIDGEEDAASPTGVQRMASDLTNAWSFNLAGARHFPQLERSDTVNQLISRWLASKVDANSSVAHQNGSAVA